MFLHGSEVAALGRHRALTAPQKLSARPTLSVNSRACRRRSAAKAVAAPPKRAAPAQQASQAPFPPVKIPYSLQEVDNGKILGFGADLTEDHPGFHDEAYKKRRMEIAAIARTHEVGQPIPRLEYSAEEVRVWGTALHELQKLYSTHACAEFLRCFPMFGFREDEVPQLEDMSRVIKQRTGWQIRPVAGLLHPRDFLAGLAFKTFHSTQYMRHPSRPMYTPEPDVVHELLGHVPMLADPHFTRLAHTIGLASLGADGKTIWHLTKVYWYTVEFGVVREGGEIKAFGAGILSSFGELEHMRNGNPELIPFDPFAKQPKMSYKDGYQKRYYVLDSFDAGARQLQDYCDAVTPQQIRLHHPAAHLEGWS